MPIGLSAPDWNAEKADWPHHGHSRFVRVRRHRWHYQRFGQGPTAVLLHGTAASVHSFAALADLLSACFDVVLVDLPGHGFTTSPTFWQASPEAIGRDLATLLEAEKIVPQIIIGHSAGAVAGIELAHSSKAPLGLFVGINGAFRPFEGLARFIAPTLAKATYYNPLPAYAFAKAAGNRERVRRLVEQTGSVLPERNIVLYQRLLRYPAHVSGALHMMADWHHDGIAQRFRSMPGAALLITGRDDKAVPRQESRSLVDARPSSAYEEIPQGGHLVHEEKPEEVAALIEKASDEAGPA